MFASFPLNHDELVANQPMNCCYPSLSLVLTYFVHFPVLFGESFLGMHYGNRPYYLIIHRLFRIVFVVANVNVSIPTGSENPYLWRMMYGPVLQLPVLALDILLFPLHLLHSYWIHPEIIQNTQSQSMKYSFAKQKLQIQKSYVFICVYYHQFFLLSQSFLAQKHNRRFKYEAHCMQL